MACPDNLGMCPQGQAQTGTEGTDRGCCILAVFTGKKSGNSGESLVSQSNFLDMIIKVVDCLPDIIDAPLGPAF